MKDRIIKELMDQEGKKVFNMVLRMVRNREDAEDLFQEIFVAVYQKIDKIKVESRVSYLFRTAYNKTLNRISARKREYGFLEKQKKIPRVEKEPDQEKRNRLIRNCLAQLKPREAFLIELLYYQKKSYKEIAEITGHSLSSVDSRLVRARKKLKLILEKQEIKNQQNNMLKTVLNI